MLKLRLSKNGIEIILRNTISRFSNELWKGIVIASAFHISLFLLFRVVIPFSSDEPAPLLPTKVEVDLGKTVFSGNSKPPLTFSPLDTSHSPALPRLPSSAFSYYYDISLKEPDFSQLEAIPYTAWEER